MDTKELKSILNKIYGVPVIYADTDSIKTANSFKSYLRDIVLHDNIVPFKKFEQFWSHPDNIKIVLNNFKSKLEVNKLLEYTDSEDCRIDFYYFDCCGNRHDTPILIGVDELFDTIKVCHIENIYAGDETINIIVSLNEYLFNTLSDDSISNDIKKYLKEFSNQLEKGLI